MPTRINCVTYNIWNLERWAERAPALGKFLELFDPDILCVQELRRKTRRFLDEKLPQHRRVQDSFVGWALESNIYWRHSMFEEVEHGAEDVGIKEKGHRRLFWARLECRETGRSILVGTAHLTHQRHPTEAATGHSPRVAEAKAIVRELKRLNRRREPCLFMGDMNDPVLATNVLHDAGFVSSFAALGLVPPTTFKVYPTADVALGKLVMNQCIDWIVANDEARPIASTVPRFYYRDMAPSDHWPVQAIYEINIDRGAET